MNHQYEDLADTNRPGLSQEPCCRTSRWALGREAEAAEGGWHLRAVPRGCLVIC